jgi:hypothetical protein
VTWDLFFIPARYASNFKVPFVGYKNSRQNNLQLFFFIPKIHCRVKFHPTVWQKSANALAWHSLFYMKYSISFHQHNCNQLYFSLHNYKWCLSLLCTIYVICKKNQHKSTEAKSAKKIMIKFIFYYLFIPVIYVTLNLEGAN